jgi:hypothetical protein
LGGKCARDLFEFRSNAGKRINRHFCEGGGRRLEILLSLFEDPGNVVEARENLTALDFVIGTGHTERFADGRQCLLEVEVRVTLPTLEDVQLPMHACQCRPDEAMVDLLRDGGPGVGQGVPAIFECGQCLTLAFDGGR